MDSAHAATTLGARFLVVRGLPLVLIDVEDGDDLVTSTEEHGLVRLPRFFGVDLPRGVGVGFTLTRDELRLEDESGGRLIRVARGALDPEWVASALRLRGTMTIIARDLGLDPDETPREACARADDAARAGRAVGAIVGVVEPPVGLPLFS